MLFQNILAAVFAIYSRRIAKLFRQAALPLNLIGYAIIAISGICYATFAGWYLVSMEAFMQYATVFIAAGLCFAITNILSFVVFEYVDAATATLLSTFNVISSVVFATLLISESLSWLQLVGAIIILASLQMVLSLQVAPTKIKQKARIMSVVLSVLSSVFFGLSVTAEKYLLNRVNLPTYLVFGWTFQFVGVAAITLGFVGMRKRRLNLLQNMEFWRMALPAGVIRMLAGALFISSLRLANNLSIIAVFSGLKIIFVALLGAILLKERDYLRRKIEAAVLASVGIMLMLLK